MADIYCHYCDYSGPPKMVRTVKGRHFGPPDDDSEDEHMPACPECGERKRIEEIDTMTPERHEFLREFFEVQDHTRPDDTELELWNEYSALRAELARLQTQNDTQAETIDELGALIKREAKRYEREVHNLQIELAKAARERHESQR